MLRIFNSFSKKKEAFKPINPNEVRMYVCGMTVYDYCHLGHGRVLVVFDLINRWLKDTTNNNQHPLIENKKVNFKYALQVKSKPVTIKIFCNYSDRLRDSYKRFLINNFNNKFKILNQKTKFLFSSSINPYV